MKGRVDKVNCRDGSAQILWISYRPWQSVIIAFSHSVYLRLNEAFGGCMEISVLLRLDRGATR